MEFFRRQRHIGDLLPDRRNVKVVDLGIPDRCALCDSPDAHYLVTQEMLSQGFRLCDNCVQLALTEDPE